jgi:cation transport ATPase
MFTADAALEDAAASPARRELTELIERAPKVAQRRPGDTVEEVPVELSAGCRSWWWRHCAR